MNTDLKVDQVAAPQHIIVIGASAGGLKAVTELVHKIPPDLPVALFTVIHLSKNSQAKVIQRHLQKATPYPCVVPEDKEEIKAGHLYIAPPDRHLFLKQDCIRLLDGPHENRWRPSVDVLFRSAAAAYGSRLIGVVLTGMMDDGTSGMSAIKRCGGTCIVQDPKEAEYDEMPVNVLNNVAVDYRAPIAEMGYIIDDVIARQEHFEKEIPEGVKIEAAVTERMISSIEEMEKIATHSNYTCPDCGGGLWKINNEDYPRYRCHTGHVYNQQVLLEKQSEGMEESLWVSIRMMEERRNLLRNMAIRSQPGPDPGNHYAERADDLNAHIDRLKILLVSLKKKEGDNDSYL